MKNYTCENPEFSESIKILTTSDPGHADNVNVTTEQLLQNSLVNNGLIGKVSARLKKIEDLVRRLFAFSYDDDNEIIVAGDNETSYDEETKTITVPDDLAAYDDETITLSGGSSGGGGSVYVLPPASATRRGGVKIGNGINVTEDGLISVDAETILMDYDVMATDEEVDEAIGE